MLIAVLEIPEFIVWFVIFFGTSLSFPVVDA